MTHRLWVPGVVAACLACAGCMSWDGGWTMKAGKPPRNADVAALVAKAEGLAAQAHTAAGLRAEIVAWEAVLAADPGSDRALLRLASDYTLRGAAHAESVGQAGEYWRKALQYAERAMYNDPGFRKAVDGGAQTWEAVSALGADRMEAMVLWLDAARLYFQFGQSGVVRMTNPKWPDRMAKVVDRVEALAPDRATVAVGRGYVAMARSNGKDVAAAQAFFDRAVAQSPDCIKPRWIRAKFLNVPADRTDAAIADLEWILAQDPAGKGRPEWNAYFQADARRMRDAIR